jgi:hypothetical protein
MSELCGGGAEDYPYKKPGAAGVVETKATAIVNAVRIIHAIFIREACLFGMPNSVLVIAETNAYKMCHVKG